MESAIAGLQGTWGAMPTPKLKNVEILKGNGKNLISGPPMKPTVLNTQNSATIVRILNPPLVIPVHSRIKSW